MKTDPNQTTTAADPINDNTEPPANAITLTDLAAMSGLDEDVLLQRLAGILRKREARNA